MEDKNINTIIGGKKDEPALTIKVKARMDRNSYNCFYNQLRGIEVTSDEIKYVLVKVGLSLKNKDEEDEIIFKYSKLDDVQIFIQPIIKNYVEFKTLESAKKYKEEELEDTDICFIAEVDKWRNLDYKSLDEHGEKIINIFK